MKLNKKVWDGVYKEKGKIWTEPQSDIPRLAKEWKRQGVKRILDVGCGTGRHLVYLAKKGFEMYGIDIAEHGLKIARKWLREEGLKAKIKQGDIYKALPYQDNFFDAIICIKTLNHGKIEWIRKCIKEMHRILKDDGYIFVTVHKHQAKKNIPKDRLYGIKWIAPRTYVILGGPEKGIPHYRFSKVTLIKELRPYFRMNDFWIDKENYYCYYGRKKSNIFSRSILVRMMGKRKNL